MATSTHAYDSNGGRVSKTDNVGTTYYISRYYDIENGKIAKHIYVGDREVSTIAEVDSNPLDPNCKPPASGDWTISTSCTFIGSAVAPANVIINPGTVLTVTSDAILEIDLHNYKLLVKDGGGVLIKNGGTIRQTSGTLNQGTTTTEIITTYLHTDHLGGSNVITDENGQIIQLLDYFPFGSIRLDEKNTNFNEKNKFTGHEYDAETGLNYMKARYQSGRIGRFISVDPLINDIGRPGLKQRHGKELLQVLADPQSLNSYSYVKNNPLKYIDPVGETEWWALFLPTTGPQLGFWHGVSNVLSLSGNRIAAGMLRHSLSVEPGNMVINSRSDKLGVIDAIKGSSEYQSYVSDRIQEAEASGALSFEYLGDNTETPSLTFNSGDLEKAIHGTYNTHISGQQSDNGSWNLQVNIVDYYDYKWGDTYQKDYASPLNIGAKSATVSQSTGVVSNYFVDVSFNDTIE